MLPEEQIRRHLHSAYSAEAKLMNSSEIDEEIESIELTETSHRIIAGLIRQNARVIMYPAGRLTAWLIKNSFISELNIIGISDRNISQPEKYFQGYTLFPSDMIPALMPDVVLVTSNLFKDQICNELSYLEKENIKIIPLYK